MPTQPTKNRPLQPFQQRKTMREMQSMLKITKKNPFLFGYFPTYSYLCIRKSKRCLDQRSSHLSSEELMQASLFIRKNGALDEWLSQRSAKPSTAVRIRQAPLEAGISKLRFPFFFTSNSRPYTLFASTLICSKCVIFQLIYIKNMSKR